MKKVAYTPKEVIAMLNKLKKEFLADANECEKDEKMDVKDGKYQRAIEDAQAAYTIDYAATRLNQLILEIKSQSK